MDILKDSSVYQWIAEEGRSEGRAQGRAEGRIEEAIAVLLRLASQRFDPPDIATRSSIEAIGHVRHLDAMIDRVLDAVSWQDLLETPWSASDPD